jgi:hypothetical protein
MTMLIVFTALAMHHDLPYLPFTGTHGTHEQ